MDSSGIGPSSLMHDKVLAVAPLVLEKLLEKLREERNGSLKEESHCALQGHTPRMAVFHSRAPELAARRIDSATKAGGNSRALHWCKWWSWCELQSHHSVRTITAKQKALDCEVKVR